jgi:endogenous inhibitor of DNA gyrase (YacG/DUF329 family)
MPMPKKTKVNCFNCGKETSRSGYKYCSNTCQMAYQHQVYIDKWRNGDISGLQCIGIVSCHIKRYLRNKYKDRCCLCGWAKINLKTGLVPLVADHIDGNWRNNTENNLRLICPNCDALSSTYAGLNRGNGRKNRTMSIRASEGRIYSGKCRSNSGVE